MTEEHCGHLGVCYFCVVYGKCKLEMYDGSNCPHDTRSHSSAGPVPEKTNGGDPWNCTDLGIECPDPEQDWCDWPCDKWLEYHDAAVARAERERVHKRLLTLQTEAEGIECVTLADIECLFAELESLRSGEGVQR